MSATKPSWQGETSAALLAALAHAGQTDHQGEPYIAHPKQVVLALKRSDRYQYLSERHQSFAVQAAWLHDVAEDNPDHYNCKMLYALGVPMMVVEAVDLLTHVKGTPRKEYLERIATNRIALAVKWADNAANSEPKRNEALAETDPARAARLVTKYERDREILLSAEAEQ